MHEHLFRRPTVLRTYLNPGPLKKCRVDPSMDVWQKTIGDCASLRPRLRESTKPLFQQSLFTRFSLMRRFPARETGGLLRLRAGRLPTATDRFPMASRRVDQPHHWDLLHKETQLVDLQVVGSQKWHQRSHGNMGVVRSHRL